MNVDFYFFSFRDGLHGLLTTRDIDFKAMIMMSILPRV